MAELGVRDFESMAWFAFVAPATTPRATIMKLHQDLTTVLAQPDVKARIEAYGMYLATSTPDELAKRVTDDIERLGALVRKIGAKVD